MTYRKQYQYGGSPVVQQYGLGGFFKKVARAALPIAGSIIGGPVGGMIGGAISSAIGGSKQPQQQAMQQVQQGPGVAGDAAQGITDADLESTMKSHIEEMHARRTDSRASIGGGFRFGGPLPFRTGGALKRLGGTAVEFSGPKHEQGGIRLSRDAEVEGGETMDFVAGRNGSVSRKGVPYVFSDTAKVPGSTMTFAKYHKGLVKRGATPEQISSLAQQQEQVTGRSTSENGEYGVGGFLEGAGKWLGENSDSIMALAPTVLNAGRAAFSNTDAPQMGSIEAQQIAGPNREDFANVSRSGLDELRGTSPLRLDYSEAYARNSAANRTAQAGMPAGAAGIAGRLAALAGARRGNLELAADQAQREDMFNAQQRAQLQAQRGQLAGQYDLADQRNRSLFGQMKMNAEQFNAQSRGQANQFNTQAAYNNQVGKAQAEEARWNMLGSAATGLSDWTQRRADLKAQKESNQTALDVAYMGASEATQKRMDRSPQFAGRWGTPAYHVPGSTPIVTWRPGQKQRPGINQEQPLANIPILPR